VASNSSMLTSARGGGGSGLACGSCPRPSPQHADPSGMSGAAFLDGSGSHHLSQLAYIIRHGNSPVEFDASYIEVNTT
jgi:hypothetical protein